MLYSKIIQYFCPILSQCGYDDDFTLNVSSTPWIGTIHMKLSSCNMIKSSIKNLSVRFRGQCDFLGP